MQEKLISLKNTLTKHGFEVKILNEAQTIEELKAIAKDKVVAMGGSQTLEVLNAVEAFKETASDVIMHVNKEGDRRALHSDVYFTSANAISMKGEIVNIDGNGNRIAATCFGPKELVYVISKNKITDTLDDAILRTRQYAAPKNTKRLNKKTPCVVTGQCEDCNSPERICNMLTITYRKNKGFDRVVVILVDAIMGY